jgi:hypothetical protein
MANHEIIHPVFGHRNLDAIALQPAAIESRENQPDF